MTLRPGTLILLDEGSMTWLEDMATIVRQAAANGCKAIITGDHGQLEAVEGGGGMALLIGKIYVRFLMFALALQAMTPDPNDLASSMLFKTLGLAPDWSRSASDGGVPFPETTQDGGESLPSDPEVPDELPRESSLPGVCLAGLFGLFGRFGLETTHLSPRWPPQRTEQFRRPRVSGDCAGNMRSTDLILALGRLTC